jgi:hypothetical protein
LFGYTISGHPKPSTLFLPRVSSLGWACIRLLMKERDSTSHGERSPTSSTKTTSKDSGS